MLNLWPAPPPPISFASLCREFGRTLGQLVADTIRLSLALFVIWALACMLGIHL